MTRPADRRRRSRRLATAIHACAQGLVLIAEPRDASIDKACGGLMPGGLAEPESWSGPGGNAVPRHRLRRREAPCEARFRADPSAGAADHPGTAALAQQGPNSPTRNGFREGDRGSGRTPRGVRRRGPGALSDRRRRAALAVRRGAGIAGHRGAPRRSVCAGTTGWRRGRNSWRCTGRRERPT